MKRIACIGRLSSATRSQLCEHVLDIFNQSRIFNASKQIHGIFLVHQDIIFQLLEGSQDKLGEAIYKARRDFGIDELTIIANYSCDKALFSSWNMRYIRPGGHTTQSHLEKIRTELAPHLKSDHSGALALFNAIFAAEPEAPLTGSDQPAATQPADEGTADAEIFHQRLMSIRAWPKASQIKLTPEVMKACALMSKGKISFHELGQRNLWKSDAEITHFLSQLNRFGILVLSPLSAPANDSVSPAPAQQEPAPSGDRFGMLMKKFLANTKLRVS